MKRFIAVLTAVLLIVFSCVGAHAATVYRYGDWTLTALTGLPDATFGVKSYDGSDAEVTVPNDYGGYPITAINAYAFVGNTTITRVTLSENITAIGDGAFMQCRSLTAVEIPDSVTEIGATAFAGSDHVVIHCNEGSYAQSFATENGMECEAKPIPAPAYIRGDATGDGQVSILDATKIQRVLAGLDADEDGMIALHGDVNGDGLDILDATRIQRFLAGYGNEFAIGEEVIPA